MSKKSTTAEPIRLGTIDEAAILLIQEYAGEDWSDEYLEASLRAFDAVREFYKSMERRPALAAFEVMVAQHFLAWMSDMYVADEPMWDDRPAA